MQIENSTFALHDDLELSVLQTSQVVYLLRPNHRNLGKRTRKSPKLYFMEIKLYSRPEYRATVKTTSSRAKVAAVGIARFARSYSGP